MELNERDMRYYLGNDHLCDNPNCRAEKREWDLEDGVWSHSCLSRAQKDELNKG